MNTQQNIDRTDPANNIDKETQALLDTVSGKIDLNAAFNIRSNSGCLGRRSTENIRIEGKSDNPGLDIYIKAGTNGETCYIPACVTKPGIDDLVYNDFYVGKDANVTIVAGCGIHTENGEPSRHNGIHRFFLEEGAHVLYEEKHIGTGASDTQKIIDPQTEVFLAPNSYLEMDTVQLGGVTKSIRKTKGKLEESSKLVIKERLLTDGSEHAESYFDVELAGKGSGVNLMSRSVAKGDSYQKYQSNIIGNTECTGHSECDAILADNGRVDAIPMLVANSKDAALIHEAAIGKIAGEQILKLRTLGLTEEEAEAAIVEGFLK